MCFTGFKFGYGFSGAFELVRPHTLYLYLCNGQSVQQVLTQDALRMRLKRLCEKKSKSQKCHVDDETHQQYLSGGPEREWLEMALLEALQSVGPEALGRGKAAHRQVQAPSLQSLTLNPKQS